MNINELRLDNWVKPDGLPPERVTLEMFRIWATVPNAHLFIDPIPLTDKWLREFGFYQQGARLFRQIDFGENWKWEGWRFGSSPYHNFETLETSVSLFDKREWPLGEPMLYVHQLQNRYYSLTNKELQHYAESTTGTN